MNLYFENDQGKRRKIAKVKDKDEAMDEIYKFCNERNFKVYYVRSWDDDDGKWFDVGSHTEFFILSEV